MSTVFGEQTALIECGEVSLTLDYCIVEPNFLKPVAIMHESVLTGKRTWSRNERFVEFEVMIYLFKYPDGGKAVLNSLLAMEDQEVNFFMHSDGFLTQLMWLVGIDVFALIKPYSKDVAILSLANKNYLRLSSGPVLDDATGQPILDDNSGNEIIGDGITI